MTNIMKWHVFYFSMAFTAKIKKFLNADRLTVFKSCKREQKLGTVDFKLKIIL